MERATRTAEGQTAVQALFYVGNPHMAMGDAEVALTEMEGSLRTTLRLTLCKTGSKDEPSVAYRYPFAETARFWVPIGLSDPDGSGAASRSATWTSRCAGRS